jgi:hypothetical protein
MHAFAQDLLGFGDMGIGELGGGEVGLHLGELLGSRKDAGQRGPLHLLPSGEKVPAGRMRGARSDSDERPEE